jgi:hypothetical protein
MYLLFAITALLLTLAYAQSDISEIPFSQLTLKLIGDRIFTIGGYCVCIFFAFKSFEKDRIWPWRWTVAFLGNLAIRIGVCLICGAVSIFLYQSAKGGIFKIIIIGASMITCLWAMFSSEFNYFKEKPNSKYYQNNENHENDTTVDT